VILYSWRGIWNNFGDELNAILWPILLPGFFDEDPAVRFLGIGSVLDRRHPPDAIKLVAGSGYGGYEPEPRIDENWIIHWVRGPRSAAVLGLPSSLGLGDPAVLLPSALGVSAAGGQDIGFMPHFESAARGAWRQATEQAGMRLIDPREDPLTVLHAIGRCKVLLSEALHGVIVADALRVPWVAIRPVARIHRAKWGDWADTIDLHARFHDIPASTLSEWAGASSLGSWHATRVWLGRQNHHLERLTPDSLVARASLALRRAASADPQLSSDAALDRCRSRMLDAIHTLAINPLRRPGYSPPLAAQRLQIEGDSAYEVKLAG
jgi:succinoglycan biosynthesis protein ExoV